MTVFCNSPFEKLAQAWEHRLNWAIETLEAEITGPNSPLSYTDFTQWQMEWEAEWTRTGRHQRKHCVESDSVQGSEEPSSLLLHKFDINVLNPEHVPHNFTTIVGLNRLV